MSDKRQHLRLPVESRTFIELISPQLGESDTGRLVACQTLNISRGGLQVTLEEEVTVGAILQIGVELPNQERTLYLAGEVRWCTRTEEGSGLHPWSAGFKLLNASSSDIDLWVELLAAMEE